MARDRDINEILRKALELLQSVLAQNQHLEPNATTLLANLHKDISQWDEASPISDFESYWLAPEANDVSAEGIARMAKANLTVFVNDPSTQEKLRQLIMLRKKEEINFRLVGKIAEVGLIEHVERFVFSSGNRPLFYVNRILIMLFPELFTSIADRVKLDKTARILGIKGTGVAFERVQFQVRDKVNDFLIEEGRQNESDFVKRGIAWWVIEAEEEL